MIYKKFIIVLLFTFLFISCNNSTNPDQIKNNYYPLTSNLEWEYNTINEIGYYDTLGNIKNTEIFENGNTIVSIETVGESINNFKDLIKFVSYEVGQSNLKAITWYQNTEDGLYCIAYINAGAAQPVIPKIINGRRYLRIDDLKQINVHLNFNLALNKIADDSLQFWTPPRKVLAYPLTIGNSWIELQIPFKRDRIIEAELNINIDGVNYDVYKIASIWPTFGLIFNDYISTKQGLVLREILADSVIITTAESPDGIGFAKMNTTSKLVRSNF